MWSEFYLQKYRERRSTKIILFAYLYLRPASIDEFDFGDEPHKRGGETSITFADLQLEFAYAPRSGLVTLHGQVSRAEHLLMLLESI